MRILTSCINRHLISKAVPMGHTCPWLHRVGDQTGVGQIKFDDMVKLVRRSQDRVAQVLGSMTDDEFAVERTRGERTFTTGSSVHFSYFHDTYHVGQTELLRQMAGTNDKLI